MADSRPMKAGAAGHAQPILLRGGSVLSEPEARIRRADVLLQGSVIAAVGLDLGAKDAMIIDCGGRVVLPGFIDVHAHADGAIFADDVQAANLRQGVTTTITGQDGVGLAPGDGRYAGTYFRALNGNHPHYSGPGVHELLSSYEGRIRLNVAYSLPAGTLRHEVMGDAPGQASPGQLTEMVRLVDQGMRDGALGLSTGLDYVPGLFADADELVALCSVVARHDGVHASHMRHGYEQAVPEGMAELRDIALRSGVRTHVAHLHGPHALIESALNSFGDLEVSFDAYPYRRGCTLLAMPVLPADLLARGADEVIRVLGDPVAKEDLLTRQRASIAQRPDMGAQWAANMSFVHLESDEYRWATGKTVEEAAQNAGMDPLSLVFNILAATGLQASVVTSTPTARSDEEFARILSDPRHVGGSDGIYVGAHPHPRGWGAFARIAGKYHVDRGDLSLSALVEHLSTRPADIMRLGRRGRVLPGWIADLIVMDPAKVRDMADYAHPRRLATGVDDVLVAGVPVVAGGRLLDDLPGSGIRRQRRVERRDPRQEEGR